MIYRLGRVGLGFACVFAPFAALASGCTTVVTNNPLPDSSVTPTPDPVEDAGPTTPDATTDPDSGPRADGVIREAFFQQLTVDDAVHRVSNVPGFARSGNRIVFPVTGSGGNPTKIYVVDADGSNLKQVDEAVQKSGTPYPHVAISGDGNMVAWSDGVITRVAGTDGLLKNNFEYTGGSTAKLALTDNGSTLFFVNGSDDGTNARGVYKVATTPGAQPQLVLGPDQAAQAFAKTAADIGQFRSCTAHLAISGDGTKLAVAAYIQTSPGSWVGMIVGMNGATPTKVLEPLTDSNKLVMQLGMSKDGSLVGYHVAAANPSGAEVGVVKLDGTGRKKLDEVGAADGCSSPITLTDDNKTMALGHTGVVYPTDGSEPWTLIAPTANSGGFYFIGEPSSGNSQSLSMSGDGKRFVYLNNDAPHPAHVAIAELNENKLGAAPPLSEPKVTPGFITTDTATTTGSSASISARSAPSGVFLGSQMFRAGKVERSDWGSGAFTLGDDAQVDAGTAGDGLYATGDRLRAYKDAQPGNLTLRVKVEKKDAATGKRSAHLLDFGPLEVKKQ